MDIIISAASGTPIYQQIANQMSAQILKGELPPGSPLPPIRTVARQLEVSVITVKKAWEELEHGGFIYGVVGRGSFVSDRHPGELDDKREELARRRMEKDLPFYRELGLTVDDMVELVRRLYDDGAWTA
jgi:GntR family transcriptional regulator